MNKLFTFFKNYWKKFLICFILISTSTIIWEHVGRKYNHVHRPSVWLEFFSVHAQCMFKKIGIFIAWISSFLTQIDLKDLLKTIHDLIKPTFDLVTSPLYIIVGYINEATTYIDKTWLVYIGSVILLCCIFYGLYFIYKRYRLRKSKSS